MVVLSVVMCTKGGKPIISRQFVEMSRIRIEGLVAAFPKLVGSGDKQHTYVETESVRYVYQPMDQLFLLLITNKGSNIMEDLDTLHLLSKVIPDQCAGSVTADRLSERAFELLFAIDEAVAPGGHKEGVTLQQIRTNLEMESHEEKLSIMIEQSKINGAKEEGIRKADMIRDRKRESARLAKMGLGGGAPSGMGGGSFGGGGGGGGGGSYGGGSFGGSDYPASRTPPPTSTSPPRALSPEASSSPPPVRKAAGMKLGMKLGAKKSKPTSSLLGAVMAEDGLDASVLDPASPSGPSGATSGAAAAIAAAAVASADAVSTVIEEKVTVSMTRDGALESMEVKGTLALTVNNPDAARCRVVLNRGDTSGFQFQNHPNISKPLYSSDAILALKKEDRSFPVGNPIGVLRWRSQHKDESRVPIVFNVWPEEMGGGVVNVNIEYTLQDLPTPIDLNNVVVTVPLGTSAAPEVESCDGLHNHNARDQCVEWCIDMVDSSNSTGSFEFNIAGRDLDAFFPVTVSFQSSSTLCPVDVREVVSVEDESKLRCATSRGLVVDSYIIE